MICGNVCRVGSVAKIPEVTNNRSIWIVAVAGVEAYYLASVDGFR